MADSDESRLVIEFDDTGEMYDGALSYSIQSAFSVDSDAWSATVANESKPSELRRKFQIGRPVKLYLNDRLQLIGRIGQTSGTGGDSGALNISGRDYIADLMDSDIDPSVRITSKMTLRDALLEGLRPFGITEIEDSLETVTAKRMGPVKYELRPAASVDATSIAARLSEIIEINVSTRKVSIDEPVEEFKPSQKGEGAIQWAKRLAAHHGGSIQPGSKRSSISVVAPDYTSPARFRFTRPGNIQRGTATRNGDDIPSFVTVSGRHIDAAQQAKGNFQGFSISGADSPCPLRNTREGRAFIEASGLVDRRLKRSEAVELPKLYKPMYHVDDQAKNKEQLIKSTQRLLAERARDFFQYSCTVLGHTDVASGATYAINTLAEVADDIEDVTDKLWISDTTIKFDPGAGKVTNISMIIPGSYVI